MEKKEITISLSWNDYFRQWRIIDEKDEKKWELIDKDDKNRRYWILIIHKNEGIDKELIEYIKKYKKQNWDFEFLNLKIQNWTNNISGKIYKCFIENKTLTDKTELINFMSWKILWLVEIEEKYRDTNNFNYYLLEEVINN